MRSLARPERPLVVAAVLLTALVTLWLLVPTVYGHLATYQVGDITVSPTDVEMTEDGEAVAVTFAVHNPTPRAVQFNSGRVNVYDGDTKLSTGTTMQYSKTTIPSGETKRITGTVEIDAEHADQTRRAIETDGLRYLGELDGEIGDNSITITVGGDEP